MAESRSEMKEQVRQQQERIRQRAAADLIEFVNSKDPAWLGNAIDQALRMSPRDHVELLDLLDQEAEDAAERPRRRLNKSRVP